MYIVACPVSWGTSEALYPGELLEYGHQIIADPPKPLVTIRNSDRRPRSGAMKKSVPLLQTVLDSDEKVNLTVVTMSEISPN
jgi:hypothetical protein